MSRSYGGRVDETAADLTALQAALDDSAAASGGHLRTAFSQERRPTAAELVAALPGIFELHLAVVTPAGAPLVAPLDAILFRGRVWIGLPPESLRGRLLARDPRVSASFTSAEVALIVHGTFRPTAEGTPEREAFDAVARRLYVAQYGDWFDAWLDERLRTKGAGPTGWIEPRRLFARGPMP
jgi:hypothetical protein